MIVAANMVFPLYRWLSCPQRMQCDKAHAIRFHDLAASKEACSGEILDPFGYTLICFEEDHVPSVDDGVLDD